MPPEHGSLSGEDFSFLSNRNSTSFAELCDHISLKNKAKKTRYAKRCCEKINNTRVCAGKKSWQINLSRLSESLVFFPDASSASACSPFFIYKRSIRGTQPNYKPRSPTHIFKNRECVLVIEQKNSFYHLALPLEKMAPGVLSAMINVPPPDLYCPCKSKDWQQLIRKLLSGFEVLLCTNKISY